jgi:phosphate transport system permease protein
MASAPITPQQAIVARAAVSKRSHAIRGARESGIKWFTFVCALISVLTTFSIVAVLLIQAVPFFSQVSLKEFFTGTEWRPEATPGAFGVLPLLAGTLVITIGAGIIAVPLGLLSAIYLSEYAHPKVRAFLKPALELLAGIPTVVYGFLALSLITPALKHLIPSIGTFNALSGAIVVGIMILPLVSSLCEDALTSVPKSLREAAYGLGATKMEVTLKIAVPAALSGIMASFILALSRALGETMAVTLASGAGNGHLTLNPAESIQTMTAYIVNVTKGDAAQGTVRYNSIFAVGITLFVMTLLMNLLAQKLVKKFRKVYS